MKKKRLRKSEAKELLLACRERFGRELFSKKDSIELIETAGYRIIAVNGMPSLFYAGESIVPTLRLLQEQMVLKRVIVDMGAVRFVIGGADIMRPGVVGIEQGIRKGEFVAVVDENNRKPLSVSKALFDADEMEEMAKGKVLENIHYVGDKLWNV